MLILSKNELFRKTADLISRLFYPENIYCACCGDSMEGTTRIHGICDKCAGKIRWISDNPFRSSMDEFAFDELLACCIYGWYPRQIIHRFKLGGCTYLARPLGKLLAERIRMSAAPEDFDGVCFIPSAPEKLARRGYNQARLLAEEAAKELGLPLLPVLQKPHDTASMRLSSGSARRTMLDDAFQIDPALQKRIEGARLLLVDDVLTTGSTTDEAARTLKAAGCKTVCVAVFASSTGNHVWKEDPEDAAEPLW